MRLAAAPSAPIPPLIGFIERKLDEEEPPPSRGSLRSWGRAAARERTRDSMAVIGGLQRGEM
ncbi:unnamed protein product [Linum tenue]|uniref:Uncharacterized protein n=1 Tax=Linum tenue TaxID=586396 RepID=A0AAV0PEY7_9ROSI|nr:unnamed protein product [Linum tenue]